MASIAQSLPASKGPFEWLFDWLRDELAPYPGRTLLVTRMVLAAMLIVIIGMTFQIPYAWQGAVYALLVSRESPRATLKSASIIFLVTGIGAAYIILSMSLVLNSPPLHFLWIIATFFFAFYGISTLTNYMAAVAFVNTISVGIPLWDRHVSAETNVEDILRLCLATLIAVVVTAVVELVFVRQKPGDEILLPMTERLSSVEDLLSGYAEGRAPDKATQQKIVRLAMLGTSLLRRTLTRSYIPPQYSAAAGGVAVLIGRLVDLAASVTPLSFEFSAGNRTRFRNLASALASIRNDLTNREIPAPVRFNAEAESPAVAPLLGEMERTATRITEVFAGTRSVQEFVLSPDQIQRPMLLSRDAFVNPEHLRFALKGCFAASACYVMYDAMAWPGISTGRDHVFADRAVHDWHVPSEADASYRGRDRRGLCDRNGLADFHFALRRLNRRVLGSIWSRHCGGFLVHDIQSPVVILRRADRSGVLPHPPSGIHNTDLAQPGSRSRCRDFVRPDRDVDCF